MSDKLSRDHFHINVFFETSNFHESSWKIFKMLFCLRSDLDDGASSGSEEENGDSDIARESFILLGISRYLLPKVGKGVNTLVLECSKALSNGLVSLSYLFSSLLVIGFQTIP